MHFKVPVVVLFSKYDQFLRNVEMHLFDYPSEYLNAAKVSEAAERQFQEHYLHPLGNDVRYVWLESWLRIRCQGYKLMLFSRNAQARWVL